VIALWGLAAFLAAVFLFGLVLLARTPHGPSGDGEPGLRRGMVDPMAGIGVWMAGAADGTSGGSGHGGCSSYLPDAHCGAHSGHFFGHL
jgi:hypothetical protein